MKETQAHDPTGGDAPGKVPTSPNLAGKYLNFRLDNQFYAFPLLKVREIIRLVEITHVPRTKDCIRGIINLRGKIIPVIDLRKRFSLSSVEDTAVSCIIVVDVDEVETGVVVDSVAQVVALTADQIEHTPAFGSGNQTEYILAIGKAQGYVTLLLDLQNLMPKRELAEILGKHAA